MPDMILNKYGNLNYHTYPAPNWDAVNGTLTNNSYAWMPTWLKNRLDGAGVPRLPSIITEFGWNPGVMDTNPPSPVGCNLYQWMNWPTDYSTHSPGSSCNSSDGVSHSFYGDVTAFIGWDANPTQRHFAEVVAVWIARGWNPRADGIRADGIPEQWFELYRTNFQPSS